MASNEKPKEEFPSLLMGMSSESIRQLLADLDARIQSSSQGGNLDLFLHLKSVREFYAVQSPLATATAELQEAQQALASNESKETELKGQSNVAHAELRAKLDEMKRETQRLESEVSALDTQARSLDFTLRSNQDASKLLRSDIEEKQISLESLQTGVPHEEIVARVQKEKAQQAKEEKERWDKEHSEEYTRQCAELTAQANARAAASHPSDSQESTRPFYGSEGMKGPVVHKSRIISQG